MLKEFKKKQILGKAVAKSKKDGKGGVGKIETAPDRGFEPSPNPIKSPGYPEMGKYTWPKDGARTKLPTPAPIRKRPYNPKPIGYIGRYRPVAPIVPKKPITGPDYRIPKPGVEPEKRYPDLGARIK